MRPSAPLVVPVAQSDIDTLVTACAVDPILYTTTFFPNAVRQRTPRMHAEMWDAFENPRIPYLNLEAFRGSAKTTLTRLFLSRRMAYGTSRTMLYIGDTETSAVKSIQWIAQNIENNRQWAQAFGLHKGKKWTENDIEVVHAGFDHTIRLIGLGITGQIRGINIGDYRPDLIVMDDVQNDENTATVEQRQKLQGLVFGAVLRALAPRTENPLAKAINLATPLDLEDLPSVLERDPLWTTRRYSCFDPDGRSRWEERFPTEQLELERQGYIARNQLHLWLREMECKIISADTAAFRQDWLQYWQVLPDNLRYVMAIDPASSDDKKASNQVIVVLATDGQRVFLVDYHIARGQNPEETAQKMFAFAGVYQPMMGVGIETVAYQRILKWYLEEAMRKRNFFIPTFAIKDNRRKGDRIRQALTGRASHKLLFVHQSHKEFISDFVSYPAVSKPDLLDATAMGVSMLAPWENGVEGAPLPLNRQPLPPSWRRAP